MSKFRRGFKKKRKKPRDTMIAGEAVLDAVENQLAANEPPQTQETLNRLMASGETRENAMRFIANVLLIEILDAVQNNKSYNEARYLTNLANLSTLPNELA